VGSSKTLRVDVRVIAATNRDLGEAILVGRFRSDLFYRLNVFPLTLPPLRGRRSDIPQLVMYFLAQFCKRFGKKIDTVTQDTMNRLVEYHWPGNIRELQNVIERAVILSQGSVLVLEQDLLSPHESGTPTADHGGQEPQRAGSSAEAGVTAASPASPLPSLETLEQSHIRAVLERTAGVIEGPNGAARILGLHPNTLRSRMKKLGIKRIAHEMS
jgi:formate hydrogenlyase transcriptional activator